jgi:uncharacterized damage-inducible protein DinB
MTRHNLKERFLKNLVEELGGKLGRDLGDKDLGSKFLSHIGDIPDWAKTALSIGTTTLLEIPNSIANPVARYLGVNQEAAQRILNEGWDQGVQEFLRRETAAKTSGAQLTDKDMRSIVQKIANDMDARGALSPLMPSDGVMVIVSTSGHVFHVDICPAVKQEASAPPQGKGQRQRAQSVYKNGFQRMPIKQALALNYAPTIERCCNGAARAHATVLPETKRTFLEIFNTLTKDAQNKYRGFLKDASPEEKARMMRAEGRTCTPAELEALFHMCETREDYLARLPEEPKKEAPKEPSLLKKLAEKVASDPVGALTGGLRNEQVAAASAARSARHEENIAASNQRYRATLKLFNK